MPWVAVKRHWGVNARPRWRIVPEEWRYLTSNVAEKLEWCHRRATMLMDEIDWRGAPGHACARHICVADQRSSLAPCIANLLYRKGYCVARWIHLRLRHAIYESHESIANTSDIGAHTHITVYM